MISFPTMEIEKYLCDIMKLNPFDAVVILKLQSNGNLSVEIVNQKASTLSPNMFERGMDAQKYFEWINWQQLLQSVQNLNEEFEYINLENNLQKILLYIQPIQFYEEFYYCMIIRPNEENENSYACISFKDENSGLLNRKALNLRWDDQYRHHKDNLNLSLLLVDLDRFKKYNESLGNVKADYMIKMISDRLYTINNERCELFRYNGDEFVFLVKHAIREEVELVANKILNLFKDPYIIDEQEYFVTSSIGIATVTSEQQRDLELLIQQAERAVFFVKNHGRSHYRFYREEMSHSFKNEVLMEAHLRRAIEFNELFIHLQPQVDFQTNQIDSFEALIRWNNPKFGYVPPSQFIPIAESSGLIIGIGDWVLEQVCKYQQQWRKKGYRPVRVAVNISPKQFKQEEFVDKIQQILTKYEVDPKYIELEITESSMVNVDETKAILSNLKKLGVYVSVDDFGTGYSSLSYLKKYPIDIIKIDQSFIADINKDNKNEAIIKAIITLSQNLGMDVIAEGVEEKHQETFLKEHCCKKGQGYLYNKPLPVEQIIEQYLSV